MSAITHLIAAGLDAISWGAIRGGRQGVAAREKGSGMSRLTTRARRRTRACVLGVVAVAAVAALPGSAAAAPGQAGCDSRTNNT